MQKIEAIFKYISITLFSSTKVIIIIEISYFRKALNINEIFKEYIKT